MKWIVNFFLVAGLAYLAEYILPWWSIAIAAALPFMIRPGNGMAAFFTGFLAIFSLWTVLSIYLDHQTASILTEKVALLFSMNKWGLFALTGFTGGITAGLAAYTGNTLGKLINRS